MTSNKVTPGTILCPNIPNNFYMDQPFKLDYVWAGCAWWGLYISFSAASAAAAV